MSVRKSIKVSPDTHTGLIKIQGELMAAREREVDMNDVISFLLQTRTSNLEFKKLVDEGLQTVLDGVEANGTDEQKTQVRELVKRYRASLWTW